MIFNSVLATLKVKGEGRVILFLTLSYVGFGLLVIYIIKSLVYGNSINYFLTVVYMTVLTFSCYYFKTEVADAKYAKAVLFLSGNYDEYFKDDEFNYYLCMQESCIVVESRNVKLLHDKEAEEKQKQLELIRRTQIKDLILYKKGKLNAEQVKFRTKAYICQAQPLLDYFQEHWERTSD